MSISLAPKRAITALFGAAIAGSALLTAVPAFAQSAPVVAVTPNLSNYSNGQTVQVKVTGLEQDTDYRLGLCTVAGIPPTDAPACAASVQVDSQADSNGEINAQVTLVTGVANAHAFLPGQPALVDFSAEDSANITVAEHIAGIGGSPVAYSSAFSVR